jgi:hypothetical protein
VLQHISASATGVKDAYLVSLTGDAKDAGYVVLRRVRVRVCCQRALTLLALTERRAERQVVEAQSSLFDVR